MASSYSNMNHQAYQSSHPAPVDTNSAGDNTVYFHSQPIPGTTPETTGNMGLPNTHRSQNFVSKLWDMVNDPTTDALIHWMPDGLGFNVTNHNLFSQEVLPKVLKHNNFQSFVRQLNAHNFHKQNRPPRRTRDQPVLQNFHYAHINFIRGRPDLLVEIKRRAPDAPSIVATPRPYDLQPIPQPPVAPAPAPLNFGSDRGSYLGSALSQAPWPRDGFSLPPLSSLDLPEVPHSHDAPVEGNDPPPYLDSVFRNPSRMDVDTTGLTARGHLSSNEGPGGSHMHPSAPQVPSFRPREVGERREPSLFRTSSGIQKTRRRPLGHGRRAKSANTTPRATPDPTSSGSSRNPLPNGPSSESSSALLDAEFEDISDCVTISSEHPANVSGHFCDLFVGTHTTKGKVALKRPRLGPEDYTNHDVRRFLREADTWRGLEHAFILPFIGTCRIGGHLYMVSPFIDNGTLSAYLNAHPEVDRARLLYEIAEALAYLHRCGVIHGDIKATNILISDDVHALLCDFGLTKFATSNTSTALKSAGSLRWQSPELWDGQQPKTYKSDTYAFGMTIAEVLSGQVPFAGLEPGGVILAVTRGQRPTTVPMFSPIRLPYYPTWRAAIYCWVNDPQKRPPMEEVARVLKSHIQATSNVTNNLPPLEPVEPEYAQQSRTSEKMSLSKYSQSSLRNHSVFARAAVGNASGKMDGLGLREKDDELGEMEYGEGDEEEGPYCYCEHDRPGAMISCGGRDCQIGWFHLDCLAMSSDPDEPWLCLQCEQASKSSVSLVVPP